MVQLFRACAVLTEDPSFALTIHAGFVTATGNSSSRESKALQNVSNRLLVGSECFSVKREMNMFERNIVGREWDGVCAAASAVSMITINMLCGREVEFLNFKLDLRAIKNATLLLRTRLTCEYRRLLFPRASPLMVTTSAQ